MISPGSNVSVGHTINSVPHSSQIKFTHEEVPWLGLEGRQDERWLEVPVDQVFNTNRQRRRWKSQSQSKLLKVHSSRSCWNSGTDDRWQWRTISADTASSSRVTTVLVVRRPACSSDVQRRRSLSLWCLSSLSDLALLSLPSRLSVYWALYTLIKSRILWKVPETSVRFFDWLQPSRTVTQ